MSNQPGNAQNNAPLFQNMDEQEVVYAPQQVPGAVMSGNALDRGGTASTTADDGPPPVAPVVPVRPDVSATTPIIAPASSYRDADDGDVTGPDRS